MLLFFSLQYTTAQSTSSLKIDNIAEDELLSVGKYISYYIDTTNSITLGEVEQPAFQQNFIRHSSELFSLPISENAIWFKITIENNTDEKLWLELGDSYFCWEIDFYTPDSSNKYNEPILLGFLRPEKNNYLSDNHFFVPLSNREGALTYYFKIHSRGTKFYPFNVGTTKAAVKQIQRYDYTFAIYFGVILVMVFYNFFVWLSVRDKVYLYYVIYLIYILIIIPFVNGTAIFKAEFLIYNNLQWNAIGYIVPALFAFEYLKMKSNAKRFYYWIASITILLGIVIPILDLTGLFDYASLFNMAALFSLIYNFSLLSAGVYLLLKGYRNARFYVIGWSFVVLTMFILLSSLFAIIPYNFFTSNITYFGFSAEAILFALALGDRINTLKKEKGIAQQKNIELIKRHAETLEVKVEERTQELQAAKDEISTQNEEMKLLNESLEKKIQDSTRILVEQNEKLKKYAHMNAHKVRGPLARILGLVVILDLEDAEPKIQDYFKKIKISAYELDAIIKEMNRVLEEVEESQDED